MSSGVDRWAGPAATLERSREPGRRTAPSDSLSWRLISDPLLTGSRNMALDHALASCLEDGAAVLRLYGWSRPTVSFGRNEPAAERFDRLAAASRGFDLVRRPTGGRTVLHDRELTYAVVVPARALGGPRQAYAVINAALATALRSIGLDARVTAGGTPLRPHEGPCFGAAVSGEVVVEGSKRVGSAQARIGKALLQHGSILLGTDQAQLLDLVRPWNGQNGGRTGSAAAGRLRHGRDVRHARDEPPRPAADGALATPDAASAVRGPAPAVRDAALPAPGAALPAPPPFTPIAVSIDEVGRAVAMSVMGALGGRWDRRGYEPREEEEADRLEADVYGQDSWTWRL